MNKTELIECTRAYIALSNAHRLDLIRPMFDAQAIYKSAYTGEFNGRDEIATMMADFFARFPDVHWDFVEYQSIDSNSIGFDFVMTATELGSGKFVERVAYEELRFNSEGYIEYLEVKER